MMRTPLVAGNWKMHKTLSDARELVLAVRKGIKGLTGVDVLVCPPFPLLFPVAKELEGSPIMLGAQNVHEEAKGAFTGEVSVPMLIDAGCTHVIVGHSERRHVFGEPGDRLARKVRAAQAGGLQVIYCIGEKIEEREAGRTEEVVSRQLEEAIGSDINLDKLILAYEPVWAIGTGKNATPEQAQEVHAFIRSRLVAQFGPPASDAMRILYGGSVKPANAEPLMSQPDVDGALVGGACLVAEDFVGIIKAALAGLG
jgi:triosephosphate isomerase